MAAMSGAKITWVCPKGHLWKAVINMRTGSQKTGCPVCNVNKAEAWLQRLCDEHPAIEASVPQYPIQCIDTFNGGRSRRLVMDQLVILTTGHRCMIELDGPQHFGPVAWIPNHDWRDQVCRDLLKNRTAKDLGFSILRISYEEYHEVDQWVDKFVEAVMPSGTNGQVFVISNAELYNGIRARDPT